MNPLKLTLFSLILFASASCQKETPSPLKLSEIISGKWEGREARYFAQYFDELFHQVDTPYVILNFKPDGIVEQSVGKNIIVYGSFSVSDVDSTIVTQTSIGNMKISEFTAEYFIEFGLSREGPFYYKYFKVE